MAVETIYDYPHYYDVLFSWDRSVEADFYDRTIERCGIGNADPILEVACGTGRVAILLVQRGRRVWGLDISRDMIEYMRRAAATAQVEVGLICADMTAFSTPQKFGAAYNPLSSFRLLHDDASVGAHLHRVAACLRPGGIYMLDMTFEDTLSVPAITTSDTWEVRRDGVTARADNDAIYVNDNGVERVLVWGREEHLRPYTIDSFVELLGAVGNFRFESWHPETGRPTGVSAFSFAPSVASGAGRGMVVLRKVSENDDLRR